MAKAYSIRGGLQTPISTQNKYFMKSVYKSFTAMLKFSSTPTSSRRAYICLSIYLRLFLCLCMHLLKIKFQMVSKSIITNLFLPLQDKNISLLFG